jgi:cobalt-zinc-cadmium efflux system outer membrane protein
MNVSLNPLPAFLLAAAMCSPLAGQVHAPAAGQRRGGMQGAHPAQGPFAAAGPLAGASHDAPPAASRLPAQPELIGPQDNASLSLPDLENIALANNPTLAQAEAALQAARGTWVQAGLYPNPMIGYMGNEIGNEGRAGMNGLFVNQEFVTGGKLRLSRAAAAQQIRAAEQQLAAQRLRVLSDVRSAFVEVLTAQRTLQLAVELERIGSEGVRAADALLTAMEVSRVDVLQARIEADGARLLLVRAQNRELAAWRRLAAVLGAPDLPLRQLSGDLETGLPELSWSQSLGRLLAESPELATAQALVGRAQWSLRRATAEPIPNIDTQSSVQYDDATGFSVANVQIGVPYPLFNANQGNIRRMQSELISAKAEVSRLQLSLQNRLATAFERYTNARAQVQIYAQQILPSARQSLELVAIGYRQGEFNYLTLLTAQRTFFQTNQAYLEALREQWQSAIAIDTLLLGESLQNRPE